MPGTVLSYFCIYYWRLQIILPKDHYYPYSGASQVVLVVKNPPASAGDMRDSIQSLGWEDPLEKGRATHSSILVLENPMDRRAWWATVHRVAESDTIEAT